MFDSEYLYGLHDPGGEQLMLDAGVSGWVVISEEIKADPNDHGGHNYTHLSGRGLGVIVRLNYGYYDTSTLPHSARYEDFARRCANFVRNSSGCRIWIIGNETNMRDEQPKSPQEQITPGLYARCYRLCRRAIKEVDPGAQVLVGAVAPWNDQTGDWIKYFEDVLKLLSGECDGFTLHTYSRSPDPATITSAETMDPPYNRYSKQFATYKDFLRVVPRSMRALPCYITETNYNGPWEDRNTGWIRRAYEDINGWNQEPGNQVIRALVLYRWASYDRFAIERTNGAKADFQQALSAGFKWPQRVVVDDPFAALRKRLADLETQVVKLLADLQKALGAGVAGSGPLVARIADLGQRAGDVTAVAAEADALTRGISSLEALLALPPGAVPQPDLQDLRGSLPQAAPYPTRDAGAIHRIVIHHTGISDGAVAPKLIAQGQVNRGRPGITYHFLINANGAIYWTQPLEATVEQTLKAEVNADSVAVALGGSFMTVTPTEAQLASAGHLVAWLLTTCRLGIEAVIGRREVEKIAPSPGAQWDTGACYREHLLADVQTWLSKRPPRPDDADLAQLRQRVDELTAQIGRLQGTVDQLRQEAQTLRDTVAQKETALADLRDAAARKELQIADLTDQVRRLQGGASTSGVVKPELKDPSPLQQHASKRYPTRPLSDIKRIIVHHTVTPGTVTPQRVAEAQVGQGRPGITYHFLIWSDGTIYATQSLETITEQTMQPAVNADSVAVALAGNFMTVAPPAAQLNAAARLIAWLLVTHNLSDEAVVGRSELETVGSPGSQWLSGAAFKNTLLAAVATERAKAPPNGDSGGNEALVAQLRSQVGGLTQERDSLKGALAQAQAEVARLCSVGGQAQMQRLQQQITDSEATTAQLHSSIAALQAEIERLRAAQPAGVPQPPLVDMIGKLPTHPTLPPYTTRTRPITLIAVHHTDTPTTHTVQNIAHYHVFGVNEISGKIFKEQWPGVGYHYIVAADGTIFHCQPDEIRSYQVSGEPNNYTVAVSLVGRFMRTDLKGDPHPPEKQEPTVAQIASAAQLIAWLMQKYNVPLPPQIENGVVVTGVVGHRDIWEQTKKNTTECPGDQWKTGIAWRDKLLAAVQSWLDGRPQSRAKPIKHYLLLWDHGADWAQADWRNAQDYIAAFRPTSGFSVADAMQAEVVTIVGGDAGVTGADEARLVAAGCRVFRLAGVDEAGTRARLTALIAADTPYPGAPGAKRGIETPDPWDRGPEASSDLPRDAWTVPDDWPPADFDLLTVADELIDMPGVTRGAGKAARARAAKRKPTQPTPTASDAEPKPRRKRSKGIGGAA
jgi:N-acetyl-anhydromuramyl-L-alanine amidase AmpD